MPATWGFAVGALRSRTFFLLLAHAWPEQIQAHPRQFERISCIPAYGRSVADVIFR
jgi:hypothetical protein